MVFIGSFLSLSVFGAETYRAHFNVLTDAVSHTDFAFTGLPCIPAFFGGLFTFHPQWNSNPVDNLPLLSSFLTMCLLIIMVILTFAKTPRKSIARLSAIVILSVLFTPLAADHHYMLLLLPVTYVLLKTDFSKSDRMDFLVLTLVLFFVLGWYPQPKMSAFAGWTKLFAFPRLYGSVLLWVLILRPNRRPTLMPITNIGQAADA
jgi:hypothetical protein